jgi:rSAM/selenodomain-associated transferase 1
MSGSLTIFCLYAKPPIPGRTKSRLAADIGNDAAAGLAAAMLLDLVDAMRQVPDALPTIWYPPDCNPDDFGTLEIPEDVWLYPQSGDDLGVRMRRTVDLLLQHHPDSRMLIIGSDCITHSRESLIDAGHALSKVDVVVQPAVDGGYVLIGQRCRQPAVFDGIDWGSHTVMAETRQRLATHEISHIELEETFDIDVLDDLELLRAFLAENDRPRTADWLSAFDAELPR